MKSSRAWRPVLLLILLAGAALGVSAEENTAKRIALTFDDAPKKSGAHFSGDERGVALLSALRKADVETVGFFVTPRNFELAGGKQRIERYAAAGHLIANHSNTHQWANRTEVARYIDDLGTADDLLQGFENLRNWYRYPYLDEGRSVEKRDAIQAGLAAHGLKNGYVTVDNYDWYLDMKWKQAVDAGQHVDLQALGGVYVETLLAAVNFYDSLANQWLGRSPVHVLLLHENDIAAVFIDDLVVALRDAGWEIVSPDVAYDDPIARREPKTLLTGQGRVAALAIDAGADNRTLTHRAIEEAQLDQFLQEREVFNPPPVEKPAE